MVEKNLQVEDNEILENLNPNLPVLAIYFFEPSIISALDFSDFHLQFLLESLKNRDIIFQNPLNLKIPVRDFSPISPMDVFL